MESGMSLVLASSCAIFVLPALGLAFVPASNKAPRGSIVAVSLSLLLRLQLNSESISNNLLLNGIVLMSLWSPLLRCVDLLLLRNIHVTGKINHKPQLPSGTSKPSRFVAALLLPQNTRYIGTPWVVKNVPTFSRTDPTYVPTRARFLMRSAMIFAVAYLFIDATNLLPPPDIDMQLPESKQAVFTRLSELDLEEFLTRAIGVLIGWIISACYVSLHYYFTALISVGSGLSQPSSWPPIFGPFTEAWSIRQFWGVSWHQQMRNIVQPFADFLTDEVFRLRRGTLVSRYTRLTIAFLVSGILHVSIDAAQGTHPFKSGAPRFFTMQALGIMLEDAIQHLYQRCGGKPGIWSRGAGYLWLSLWMVWTTPSWTWVAARALLVRDDAKLPYSPLGHLGITSS